MPPPPVQVLARCHALIFLLVCTPDLMGHVFVAGQLVRRSIHAPSQFTLLVPEPPPHQRLRKPGLPTLPAYPRFISNRSSSPALLDPAPPPPALLHASSPARCKGTGKAYLRHWRQRARPPRRSTCPPLVWPRADMLSLVSETPLPGCPCPGSPSPCSLEVRQQRSGAGST
jgi:hypothetical protein